MFAVLLFLGLASLLSGQEIVTYEPVWVAANDTAPSPCFPLVTSGMLYSADLGERVLARVVKDGSTVVCAAGVLRGTPEDKVRCHKDGDIWIQSSDYEVLCGYAVAWANTLIIDSNNPLPVTPVSVGKDSQGHDVYACRALVGNPFNDLPGQINLESLFCEVAVNMTTIESTSFYETLVSAA